jgi:hypothetical protein
MLVTSLFQRPMKVFDILKNIYYKKTIVILVAEKNHYFAMEFYPHTWVVPFIRF